MDHVLCRRAPRLQKKRKPISDEYCRAQIAYTLWQLPRYALCPLSYRRSIQTGSCDQTTNVPEPNDEKLDEEAIVLVVTEGRINI